MSQRLYRLLVLPGTRRISLINAGSVTPICFFQSFLSAVPLDHPLPFLGCSLLLLVGAAQGITRNERWTLLQPPWWCLIKDNMQRDVCFIGGGINASPPFLLLIVPSKDTPYRLLFQLCPQLVGHKDVANAPKYSEMWKSRLSLVQYPVWREKTKLRLRQLMTWASVIMHSARLHILRIHHAVSPRCRFFLSATPFCCVV